MMSRFCGLRAKLLCFLILLSSSVICYVMVTSSGTLISSPAYKRHASSRSDEVFVGVSLHELKSGCEPTRQNTELCNRTTGHNKTTSDNQTSQNHESHHLIPKNGKTIMNSSLTSSLWKFERTNDEQLYLYETLLKRKWSPNLTKAVTLREELAKYRTELNGSSQVLLHQQNIQPMNVMKFVFGSQVKPMSKDLFRRLPKNSPFPQGPRYRSCAVVGNGGIMLNSSCGGDIDKHDYVFRCNLAPLSPFKKDAGMKSNFTTMNPSMVYRNYQSLRHPKSVKKYNQDISQFHGVIWMSCYGIFYSFPLVTKALQSYKGKNPVIVCGNPKHFRSVVDFWVERELNNRLSSGFYLVTTAIQLCDEVHLYGFWPFSARYGDKMADVPYHYFDDISVNAAKSTHSMDKEFSLLMQLHNLGVLRLNVGSCS